MRNLSNLTQNSQQTNISSLSSRYSLVNAVQTWWIARRHSIWTIVVYQQVSQGIPNMFKSEESYQENIQDTSNWRQTSSEKLA